MKNALYAFVLAALALVAAVVLTVTGHDVPDLISTIGLVSVGAGGGLALPAASSPTDDLG